MESYTYYERASFVSKVILGFKYLNGMDVDTNCHTTVSYLADAALDVVEYVERTLGLDIVERKKLNLGIYELESGM